MIIVTAVPLSQIAPTDQPLNNTALILAVRQGRLVSCDWAENTSQQTALLKVNGSKAYQNEEKAFISFTELQNADPNQHILLTAISQLTEYFFGRRKSFELPMDLSVGTPFQQQVWQALQSIEFGKTISYAKLAHLIGNPKAYRAAANANGKNPLSIIIPCHRVIAHDGSLGGYTGGIDKKRYLLALEGQCF